MGSFVNIALAFCLLEVLRLEGIWWIVAAKEENCIRWGNTFDVSLESINVRRDCTIMNEVLKSSKKICCAAVARNNQTNIIGMQYVFLSSNSNLHLKYLSLR